MKKKSNSTTSLIIAMVMGFGVGYVVCDYFKSQDENHYYKELVKCQKSKCFLCR